MLIFNKNKFYILCFSTKFSKTKFFKNKSNLFNLFLGQNQFFFFYNTDYLLLNLKLIKLLLQKTSQVLFISTERQFDSTIQNAAFQCGQAVITSKDYTQGIFSNIKTNRSQYFHQNFFTQNLPSLVIIASLSKTNLLINELKSAHVIVIGFIAYTYLIKNLSLTVPISQNASQRLIYFFCKFISNLIKLHKFNS